jgi:hypothetical protein
MLSCFMKHPLLILAIFALVGSLRSEAQSVPVCGTDQDADMAADMSRGKKSAWMSFSRLAATK